MTPFRLTESRSTEIITDRINATALPLAKRVRSGLGWNISSAIIRINLVGRETKGSVPLNQYEDTCEQLKKLLLSLTNDEGQPLVRDIVSTASNTEHALASNGQHALSNPLPDLVVHWEEAAFAWPLKIKNSQVQVDL